MPPFVSVVIPSFNRRVALLRAIEALACQTLAPDSFEVIAVLDGSTDGSAEALRALSTPFDLIVLEQPNRGAGAARNTGVRRTAGELLVFIDDDVVLEPDALAAHLQTHQQRPGRAVLGSLTTTASGRGYPARITTTWKRPRVLSPGGDGLVPPRYFYSGHVSIARADIPGAGFREDLPRLEDAEFAVRLAAAGVPIVFDDAARGVHHSVNTTMGALDDAFQEGRVVARLWREEPEVTRVFRSSRSGPKSRPQVALAMAAGRVRIPSCVARPLGAIPSTTPGIGPLFDGIRANAYLHGVWRELHGFDEWRRFLNRPGP